MDREDDLAWCRSLFASVSDGGVWGVPRSGLTFKKSGDRFVLIEQHPWHPERGGTADGWRAYQDDDYEAIRERFVAAGINVEKGAMNTPHFWVLVDEDQIPLEGSNREAGDDSR